MGIYQIGKVVGVSGDEIFISLLDHERTEDMERGVPDSMTVHLSSPTGPLPVQIGQPGTFVTVALPAAKLLCMVTGIEMRETRPTAGDVRAADAQGQTLIDRATRGVSTIPVGTIDAAGPVGRGSGVLPPR